MTVTISLDRARLVENVAPVGRVARNRTVLDDVTLAIPHDRYVLVGDDLDRRCVIDLLAGRRTVAAGSCYIDGTCSYPIGRTNAFAVAVTGENMVRFLSDIYGFQARFALETLRAILPVPGVLYTRLDKAHPSDRLALSIACAQFINTDVLLIDGLWAHPAFPESFLQYVGEILPQVMAGRLVIISSRQMHVARALANQALVIANGSLRITALDQSHVPMAEAGLAIVEDTESLDDDLEVL